MLGKTFQKIAQSKIIENDYEENILILLNEKLEYLKTKSLDYYNQINESYYNVRNYLIESINNINNELNECANITYITYKEKYEEIANKAEPFNKEEIEMSQEPQVIEPYDTQNKQVNIEYSILNMTKKTRFKFDFEFEEGNILKPKVRLTIINQSRPKKITVNFKSEIEGYGDTIETFEAEINEVNYTMNIDFNTQSTDLNITTIYNLESYQYTKVMYSLLKEYYDICYTVNGIEFCDEDSSYNDNKKYVYPLKYEQHEKQEKIDNFIVKN